MGNYPPNNYPPVNGLDHCWSESLSVGQGVQGFRGIDYIEV